MIALALVFDPPEFEVLSMLAVPFVGDTVGEREGEEVAVPPDPVTKQPVATPCVRRCQLSRGDKYIQLPGLMANDGVWATSSLASVMVRKIEVPLGNLLRFGVY
jgi:hypothetical protein